MNDAENAEYIGYLQESDNRHVEHNRHSPVPGYAMWKVDTDIHLVPWNKSLQAGVFFHRLPDDAEAEVTDSLWYMRMADETAEKFSRKRSRDKAGIEDAEADKELLQLKMEIVRVTVEDGRHIGIAEALTWLAVQDFISDGNKEKATRLLSLAYPALSEDDAASLVADVEDALSQVTEASMQEAAVVHDLSEQLPQQDAIRPRTAYIPATKAAQYLNKPDLFTDGGALLDVASATEKKHGTEVYTLVSLSYDDYGDAALSAAIDEFDKVVQNGLATAWASGIRTFTARQLASSCMSIPNPTPAQTERIERSIDKQRRILCDIDFSQEARKRALSFDGDAVTEYHIERHLCPAEKHTILTKSGRKADGYVLLAAPPIYQHASAVGEVVNIPMRLLSAGRGSNTEANIIIKSHVLRRIEQMKSKRTKSLSNRIRYVHSDLHPERLGIFERAGINISDRDARKRAADYVISILADLRDAKEIRGYTEVTEKRARVAVDVFV